MGLAIVPEQVATIRGEVGAHDAIDIVSSVLRDADAQCEAAVYYPYFRFTTRCSLPTLFGRKRCEITCLVDAMSGSGSTSDRFDIDRLPLPDTELLPANITIRAARKTAQQTVSHTLGRKLRVVADFRLCLDAVGLVYKRFWIVGNGKVRVMIDSVNGGMHPISCRATKLPGNSW